MNTITRIGARSRFTVESVEEYLAFIESRPDEERWQLIDGEAIMMTPPTLRHQGIARNLVVELHLLFRAGKLPFQVLQEVGLIVSDVPVFRPQADVAVVDREAEPDANYADRFYLAAEIISKTNTAADISTKRLRYQLHPENQYCLIIDPKVVRIQVFARATGWTPVTLTSLADTLELPVLGFSCQVRTIYSGTPLAPL